MYAVHTYMIIGTFSMLVLIYVTTVHVCEQYYLSLPPNGKVTPALRHGCIKETL